MQQFSIQRVTEENFEDFLSLVIALAEFEKLPPPDSEAKQRLRKDCFSSPPRYEAFLVFQNQRAIAYAIIFETYSSFLAKPLLYLEDIFVLPEHRAQKIGTQLFRFLIDLAVKRNYGRMEWHVLDWNTGAISFYNRIGAKEMSEWKLFRLTEEQLNELNNSSL